METLPFNEKIKMEIADILSANPTYWIKKGYLEKEIFKFEDGSKAYSYHVTQKGYEECRYLALKQLKAKNIKNSIKDLKNKISKILLTKDQITLFDFARSLP